MKLTHFEWDEEKDKENQAKHNVSFSLAQRAFLDPHRVIVEDITHIAKAINNLMFLLLSSPNASIGDMVLTTDSRLKLRE
jgi:hypothetical protein